MNHGLDEIKKLRKKHGLTQSELAGLSGVSQSLIAKIEAGMIDPTFTKTKKIFDVLNGLTEKNEPKAEDIMLKKIIFAEKKDTVNVVIKKIRRHEISQLPVYDHNCVTGLVSEASILDMASEGRDLSKLKVEDVMTDAPPVVTRKTPVRIIMDLLKISPLVMITDKGRFVGVVTKADVLKSL
ncbi:MAG: CBS domain-containing protein [bacterium]|nr:CBS domain-containing protein [bacterium]